MRPKKNLKRAVLTSLAVLTLFSAPVWLNYPTGQGVITVAEAALTSTPCGDSCSYTFDPSTGTVTITGTGAIWDSVNWGGNTSVKKAVIGNGITEIPYGMFQNCTNLSSVSLPSSLTNIGYSAFKNSGLTSVKIPGKLKEIPDLCFYDCTKLKTVTFEKGVEVIGLMSFSGCTGLTEVTLPSGVTTLRTASFEHCHSLKKITIPASLKTMEPDVFPFCMSLETFSVAKDSKYFSVWNGSLYNKDQTKLIRYQVGHDTVVFAPKTKTFDDGAFCGFCLDEYDYAPFILPESIETVDAYAFNNVSTWEIIFLSKKAKLTGDRSFLGGDVVYAYKEAGISDSLPIIDGSNVSIKRGKTGKLRMPAGKTNTDISALRFIVRDPSVLTVDGNGNITPLKEGTTEIYGIQEDYLVRWFVTTGFNDVKKTDYFYEPVYWAVDKGITVGVRDSHGVYSSFNPQGQCTRAQMLAFLWRMAGSPEPKSKVNRFSDIKSDAYYYKAVLWGTENGIVGGYSDNTFRPDGICTRGQAVTFMWRYYGCPEPSSTNSFDFSDNRSKNTYYYKAVLWASENNITGGYSDGTFRPTGTCSRAQMVTFLYRSRNLRSKFS